MRGDDEADGERQQIKLVLMPQLLGNQQDHAGKEQQPGGQTVVMMAETVPQGPGADHKGQPDHAVLEEGVMQKAHPQQGEGADDQRQESAMDSAENGSEDTPGIPVDFLDHNGV